MTPKPLVQAACACERVLRERDNVPSLIRIVDTYTLDPIPPGLPPHVQTTLSLTLFVALKSGEVVGEHEVALRMEKPDGTQQPVAKQSFGFTGEPENGVNIEVAFEMASPSLGLYWFDVLWGEEVLTRIPLRLKPKASGKSSSETTAREPNQPQTVS